jgi:hypothetical protein
LRYANAKARYDGLIQSYSDDIDGQIQAMTDYFNSRTGQDGNITLIETNTGKEAFLLSDGVVFDDEGFIDKSQVTDKPLIIIDEEGNKKMISYRDINKIIGQSDAQEHIAYQADKIRNTVAAQVEQEANTPSQDEVQEAINNVQVEDVVQLNINNSPVTATVQSVNPNTGEIVVQLEKPILNEQGKEQRVVSFPADQFTAALVKQDNTQQAAEPVQTEVAQQQAAPVAEAQTQPAAEAQANAPKAVQTEQIPVKEYPKDKEGFIDYTQITEPQDFAEALMSEFNSEDANAILDDYIAETQKAVKAAEKEKDPIKKRRKVAAEQAKAERYAQIKDIINRANEQEQVETTTQEVVDQPKVEQEQEKGADEIQPIGEGAFGKIYDQFEGKVKEGINFLLEKRDGDLLGVFHRTDVGDIDLVWGSTAASNGLEHIIEKHIVRQNDFKDIDELAVVLDDVIANGDIVKEKWDKVTLEKDGYKVVISRNVRDNKGNILGEKNWVVTAFDSVRGQKEKTSSATTQVTPDSDNESRAVALEEVSDSEDTTNSENSNTQEQNISETRERLNRMLAKELGSLEYRNEENKSNHIKVITAEEQTDRDTGVKKPYAVYFYIKFDDGKEYLHLYGRYANLEDAKAVLERKEDDKPPVVEYHGRKNEGIAPATLKIAESKGQLDKDYTWEWVEYPLKKGKGYAIGRLKKEQPAESIPPSEPASGVNILEEAAKVVERAKKQPHTYNIGDIVNIKGEQYEVTGTGHILDTGEAIYDLEKNGKVAYEDITEGELKELINSVSSSEKSKNLFEYFEGSVADFLNAIQNKTDGLLKMIVAPVSKRQQNDLKTLNVDIPTDFNHTIDNYAIQHVSKRHGSEKELLMGQIPLDENDFNLIPDVLENYDNISVEKGKRGNLNVVYEKSYPNGTTIYIEEERTSRKELAMVSMRKMKNSFRTNANNNEVTPILDLETVSDNKDATEFGENQGKGEKSGKQEREKNNTNAKDREDTGSLDIFAEAEKVVKNAKKSKLQSEKSANESDKKEVTETEKDKKLSENKAQKSEIQDNEQNKKAEKSIKKEISGEEKAEKVDKKEDSEKQPWEMTLTDWNKEDEVIASNQSEIVPHGGYVRNEETKKWEWQRGRNINSDKFLRRIDSNRNPISEWFYLKRTGRKLLTEEQHRRAVLQALSEGKPVPEEVLKEYPELSKTKEDEGKGAQFRIIGETGASRMKNAEMLLDDLRVAREMEEAGNVEKLKDIVLNLFHKAAKGEITGKPIKIGDLTAKGQSFLSNLSGVDMKPYVSFVINPSDLRHIYNEHYQANEKDSGSNHPLTDMDVRNMIDVILFPEKIVSFNEDGITKFIFLAESPQVGAYNLVEVYGDKRGNLSAKSLYNTKKDVSHRAMTIIKQSRLSTSKTSGAILSETNVPNLFESTKSFDAKTIRIATGWERGADGKWRYETPDEKFTHEFVESLEKSSERYIDKRTQGSYATVEDIYGENSELLKIYPSLAEALIKINIHPDNDNGGYFKKGTKGDKYAPFRVDEIGVTATSIENAQAILIHEIQHAIQDIEGFATGGNLEEAKEKLRIDLYEFREENPEYNELYYAKQDAKHLVDKAKAEEASEKAFKLSVKLREKNRQLWEKFNELYDRPKSDAYKTYLRFSGEAEARNAKARIHMTPEERRNTLLAETEDIARDQQIVFREVLGRQLFAEQSESDEVALKAIETLFEQADIPIEYTSAEEAQRKFAEVKARESEAQMRKTKAPLNTVIGEHGSPLKVTVVSSDAGTKVLQNIDKTINKFENERKTIRGFIGELGQALGLKDTGASQYGTFETPKGEVFTLRLSNHNATVSNFDTHSENSGVSIVISRKPNTGIINDGKAHVVEFFYSDKAINKSDSRALAEIAKSIKQLLYSGEYKDTTGLAEVEEVNAAQFRTESYYNYAKSVSDEQYAKATELAKTKPSIEFIEAYNEDAGDINTTQFFTRSDHTEKGKGGAPIVYGWTENGKVYLVKENLNPETPIHEYSHIWDIALQENNRELWKHGVELLKQTKLWDEVKNDPNYSHLKTDDQIASEVKARLTGKKGAEVFTQMQQEANNTGDVMLVAKVTKLINDIKKWLADTWYWIKDTMTNWSKEDIQRVTLDDFVNMTLADMIKGKKLETGKQKADAGLNEGAIFTAAREALERANKKTEKDVGKENITNFANKERRYGKGNQTGMDHARAMGSSSINRLVGEQQKRSGTYRTIQAANEAGSVSPILTVEEREELESRGINPYWERPKFLSTLKSEAQKNGVWLESDYLADKTLEHDQKELGTSENDVYVSADNKTVTKLNNLSYVKGSDAKHNLFALIDRLEAHNTLFPSVAYTIRGFMDNKNGSPSIVLEQPFVSGVERNATQEEINEYLTSKGFKLSGIRSWSNNHEVWSNGEYELFDARPANVLKGKNGELYFIDAIPHKVGFDTENTASDIQFHVSDSAEANEPYSAAQAYEHAVRRSKKTLLNLRLTDPNVGYWLKEGFQDSMLSLKIAQEAIAKETGSPIQDFENAP